MVMVAHEFQGLTADFAGLGGAFGGRVDDSVPFPAPYPRLDAVSLFFSRIGGRQTLSVGLIVGIDPFSILFSPFALVFSDFLWVGRAFSAHVVAFMDSVCRRRHASILARA